MVLEACPEGQDLKPSLRMRLSVWVQISDVTRPHPRALLEPSRGMHLSFLTRQLRLLQYLSFQQGIPRNDVRSWLASRILECTRDANGCSNTQSQSQYAAIHLPQPVANLPRTAHYPGPVGWRLVMRVHSVDDHAPNGDADDRKET